jgi:hypothetical protein
MKTKLFATLLFVCFSAALNAQTSKATIPYNLKKTFIAGNTSVGGDLVITPENPNTVPVCESANANNQVIYNGKLLGTAFMNIDNRTGAGCVTIAVTVNNRVVKQTIPAGSVSGVISFNKVTKVVIDHKTNDTFPETVTASGSVDFWF